MTALSPLPTAPPAPVLDLLAIVDGRASAIPYPKRKRVVVRDALTAAGADPEVLIAHTPDDVAAAIQDACGRRVVLVGDDAVLHAAANLDVDLPELALIPAGRATNVARALRVPLDVEGAAQLAVGGRALGLDALRVQTPARTLRAVAGVSAGLQAAARGRAEADTVGTSSAGLIALARTLAEMPHFEARLAIDGAPAQPLLFEQMFLSTLPSFGTGLLVDPEADPRDGVDEAVILHARTRPGAISALLRMRRGHHLGRRGTEVRSWQQAELLDAVPLAADSVPLGTTTAHLSVEPAALRVVARPA